jgi:hypothetical protein
MIVYPESGWDSFISEDDADNYFETRLNANAWWTADKEAALMTAFRSLQELDIEINLSDPVSLKAIQQAQCEQALHELTHNLDGQPFSGFTIGGTISVSLSKGMAEPSRYSTRTLAILKPYLKQKLISRSR